MHKLRVATVEDKDVVVGLALRFLKESVYNEFPFNIEKIQDACSLFLSGDQAKQIVIIAETGDGKPIGMVAAMVNEILFGTKTIAHEVVWYISPEHRNSSISIRLLKAFEHWAKSIAKADFLQLSLLCGEYEGRLDNVYKHLGYAPKEKGYIKINGSN